MGRFKQICTLETYTLYTFTLGRIESTELSPTREYLIYLGIQTIDKPNPREQTPEDENQGLYIHDKIHFFLSLNKDGYSRSSILRKDMNIERSSLQHEYIPYHSWGVHTADFILWDNSTTSKP